MINFFKEKIHIKDKDSILKLHLIIKCYEKEFNLSESAIDTLIELHNTGYTPEFFDNCIKKKYYKSEQTVRNAIAKMTNMGILSYKKRGERIIIEDFIPTTQTDQLIFQYLISNYDSNPKGNL